MSNDLDEHYGTVLSAIADGELVPFLGAGVNLCGRASDSTYKHGQNLPSAAELSEFLAGEFEYRGANKDDLLRVSQYAAVMRGLGPLYRKLQFVFSAEYSPTPLHEFFASLPAILRDRNHPPYQLIVTTNYDDALERALKGAGQPFDVVTYVAEGENRGKFWHWPHGAEMRLINTPNEYHDLPIGENMDIQRTVILKIHGAVDRSNVEQCSFVITEDHYIDYLARTDISHLLPVQLKAKLRNSNYLFLGYSLRDWNLRVILRRIWGEQKLSYSSWAIQLNPEPLDQKFWTSRGIEIMNQTLESYISALKDRLLALASAKGEA